MRPYLLLLVPLVACHSEVKDDTAADCVADLEICDGLDNDCDGLVDDDDPDLWAPTWYADADADGYGTDDETWVGCDAGEGWSDNAEDCDDTDAAVHPGADELCNDLDDDCDGDIDEDPVDAPWWYIDGDGDGYGDPDLPVQACDPPGYYVDDNTDCADWDATIHPGAEELCDAKDHDCDGDIGLELCADCAALLAASPGLPDGVYAIDLDAAGEQASFPVYCDMTTDGGGWTLWWWYQGGAGLEDVEDVLGQELWDCDPVAGTRCLARLPAEVPGELLVANDEGNWAAWVFDDANATAAATRAAFTARTEAEYVLYGTTGPNWHPVAQSVGLGTTPFDCNGAGSEDVGCDNFWYDKVYGVWSFNLDDTGGWADTAFGAGYDNNGNLGVDSLETTMRKASEDYTLWLYWR